MAIEIHESLRLVQITLSGVTTEEDLGYFFKGIKKYLQEATAPIALVIDLTENDGGTAQQRGDLRDLFSGKGGRFGMCAGIAAVTKTEGQGGFLRGLLALGPMPCPYRIFDSRGEAVSWARSNIKAATPPAVE